MNPNEPADDLERELARRAPLEPGAAFRQRVLAAMRGERRTPRLGVWHFLAAAAAVLLAVNLSMSVANDADFRFGPTTDRVEVRANAARLRGLTPELSEDEAFRHALVLQAAAGRAAIAQPNPANFYPAKELK